MKQNINIIKEKKTNTFVYIALLMFMVSLCICWDNDYTKEGFALSTVAMAVVMLHDMRYKLEGFISVIISGYFWWSVLIVFLILVSIDTVASVNRLTQYIKLVMLLETVLTFGVSLFSLNRWNRSTFTRICIISTLILCGWIGIHEYEVILNITKDSRIGWSASGSNPNYIGILLTYFSAITLYEYLSSKKKLYIFVLILQYAFMFMTGSKKVLIGMIVPFSVLVLLKGKKNKIFYIIVSLLIMIVLYQLIMNVEIFYELMGVRIQRFLLALGIIGYEADTSTTTRLYYMKAAFEYWKLKPFFGYGFQAFNYSLGFSTYTHMNYLEILVSFGLVGFIIYYGTYVFTLLKLFRIRKDGSDIDMFIILIVLQLVIDIAAVSYYDMMLFYITEIGAWHLVKKQNMSKHNFKQRRVHN